MSFRTITTEQLTFLLPLLKNQARLSRMATCIFAVLSVWLLGQMVWLLLPSSALAPWTPNSGQVSGQAKPNHQLDVSALQSSDLFGHYQAEKKAEPQKVVQDAPKSRLNVTLVGVVISSVPGKSLAVIANNNQQSTYGVGEVLDGTRAKLLAVHSDRVIINNDGRDETVMLEGIDYSKLGAARPVARGPVPAPEQHNEQHNNDARDHEEQANASRPKDDSLATTLDEVRSQIKENPQQLFQYIRMSVVKRDNDIVGYRLTPGKSPELFEEIGLQEGDIATQLNGNDLSDPKVMTEMFKSIPELNEINLTVERDGQPYDIYIEL